MITLSGNFGGRVPVEMQDAVELWARKHGRHGRIGWVPGMNCFAVHLTRRPEDPMMREWKEGRLAQAEPPTESIPLHEWDEKAGRFKAIPLEELGTSGVVQLLERGDTWSGRGEYRSLTEATEAALLQNRRNKEEWMKHMNELGRESGDRGRRKAFGLPWVPGSDVPSEKSLITPTPKED